MDAPSDISSASGRPLQVGLRTILLVVTGVAVLFAMAKWNPRNEVLNFTIFAFTQSVYVVRTFFVLRRRRNDAFQEGVRIGTACGGTVFGGFLGATFSFPGGGPQFWNGSVIDIGIGMLVGWMISSGVASILVYMVLVPDEPASRTKAVRTGAWYGGLTGALSTSPIALLHPVGWFIVGGVAGLIGAAFGGWGAWVQGSSTVRSTVIPTSSVTLP